MSAVLMDWGVKLPHLLDELSADGVDILLRQWGKLYGGAVHDVDVSHHTPATPGAIRLGQIHYPAMGNARLDNGAGETLA